MLNRLNKLLGVDVKYYLSGGSYLLFSYWSTLAIGFLSTWFFTNYAAKETYGAYSYIQSILNMLIVFTLPGYYTAVVRSAARGRHGALLKSVKRRFSFSLIGTLIMVGVGIFYWRSGEPALAKGCLVGGAFFGAAFGMDDFAAFLNGSKKYGTYTLFTLGVSLLSAAATIGAILLSGNFLTILTANLAGRGIGQLVCIALAYRSRENDEIGDDFASFGNRQSAVSALGSLATYLDSVLVGAFFPLSTMAEYNLANILTNPLRNFGSVINRLVFPKMVKLAGRDFALKTFKKGLLLCSGLVVIGIAFYLALPVALTWLFPKYLAVAPYANVMIISALFGALLIYLETFYLSQDAFHKVFYIVTIARSTAIICLLPVLMFFFGVFGAIYAKLFVRGAEALYLLARLGFGWDEKRPE